MLSDDADDDEDDDEDDDGIQGVSRASSALCAAPTTSALSPKAATGYVVGLIIL